MLVFYSQVKVIEAGAVSEYACRNLKTETEYPASRPNFAFILK